MANPVPVAGGFAAALETFLSRGGSRVSKPRGKPGMRFSEGPIKGLTVEQATEKARGMWASAPDSVKEKYAGREAATMAPSERKSAMAAAIEPGMSGFAAGTRRASPGDLNGDGIQDVVQPDAAVPRGMGGKPNHPQGVLTGDGRTYVPGKGIHLGGGVFQSVAMSDGNGNELGGGPVKEYKPGAETINSAATTGAGRGTPIKGAATPEENARAQEVAREAAGQYGESAGMSQEEARGQIAGLYSTDKAPNPGVVAPAAGTQPNGGAPSRSKLVEAGAVAGAPEKPKIAAPLEGVQVGMGKNAGKMNPLTGKPIGYVPPAPPSQQIAGIERVPSAGVTFDPKYGAVPKATEVPEAPMGVDEYNRVKASQDVNDVNALDPRSPEASAARGRMRDYEKQVAAQAASAARRERVGPSPAERDAQQRQAARGLDRKVQNSYGRI